MREKMADKQLVSIYAESTRNQSMAGPRPTVTRFQAKKE